MQYLGLLGVLFVGLKLTGVITWSWWLVTLPFWGGLVALLIFIIALAAADVTGLITIENVIASILKYD